MNYTKKEIQERVEDWLIPEKVSMLYKQEFINYKGVTTDTKEKYTDVIAEQLLANLGALKKIKQITRKSSYKTDGHEQKPINQASPRKEEQIARNMMGQVYPYIGEIIDYQTPLKDVLSDSPGKIDLLSRNKEKECVYAIELKAQTSNDTLLHGILEVYTYSRIVNFEKLLVDFSLPSETTLRKAMLVYQLSLPHIHIRDTNMKSLMKKLGVDLFLLSEDNKVLDEHYFYENLQE